MSASTGEVRPYSFGDFQATAPEAISGTRRWLMRARNFWVEWVQAPAGAASMMFESSTESLLISDTAALRVEDASGRAAAVDAPDHCVCIVPAGRFAVRAVEGGSFSVIASHRTDLAGRRVLNEDAYAVPDERIAATGQPYRHAQGRQQVEVLPIAAIQASVDRPRLKMLQTETLSINVVEYNGVRDRTALSPHSHASFEQGSLALAGDFMHHLRVPWGPNATLWREDEHLAAPSPSLLIVPVDMVHTTEGLGGGRHLLIDVFSPPRGDFIGNGWVFNAKDYRAVDLVSEGRMAVA